LRRGSRRVSFVISCDIAYVPKSVAAAKTSSSNLYARPYLLNSRHLLGTASSHQAVCLMPQHLMSLGLRKGSSKHQLAVAMTLAYRLGGRSVSKLRGLPQVSYMLGASSRSRQACGSTQEDTYEDYGA
jgi:hypothetical protein